MTAKILFVVSMHRSGSSLLTKGLECFDLDLGDNLMPPANDNPKGFFEDLDVVALNDEILNICDYQWTLISQEPRVIPENLVSKYLEQAKALIDVKLTHNNVKDYFVIKDPRLCRTLPIWIKACEQLNIDFKTVFISRNFNEVAISLLNRNGIAFEGGYSLWLDYTKSALGYFKQFEIEPLFIKLDSFISLMQKNMINIGQFLERKINDEKYNIFETEFYNPNLLNKNKNKNKNINILNSPLSKAINNIESATILTQGQISHLLNEITEVELIQPSTLKAMYIQLEWHRSKESEVLREIIDKLNDKMTKQKENIENIKNLSEEVLKNINNN
ncbi:sulfotransferase family protein [Colwelliaceae bacterium 6441]